MAITVRPKTNNSIETISSNRLFRVQRLKKDLDKVFIEHSTKLAATDEALPFVDLYGFPIDTSVIKLIDKDKVVTNRVGVFAVSNKQLFVATDNPGSAGQEEIFLDLLEQGYTHKLYLCSSLSFNKLIRTFDNLIEPVLGDDAINISKDEIARLAELGKDLKTLASYLPQATTSEVINIALTAAMTQGATDIHFEPEEDKYVIRLRLDGLLYVFTTLKITDQSRIENRIKMIAGVKLNLDSIAQDGRFSFVYQDKNIDVRTSFLPSNYGYSIVMRLLGSINVDLTLDSLGFITDQSRKGILKAMDQPQGLILTTGPTGSGKTTTLYTLLDQLNDGTNKIITLEDPIEYRLHGISQTQINMESGYTFASGLRSILRQDPDIVMVGEIRDSETAEIVIQASLTGHQVFSTIHTNDAAGAIPRLLELGVHGYALADSISVVIGQRLVRKICPHCIHDDVLDEEQKGIIITELTRLSAETITKYNLERLHFQTSSGCAKCNNLGYKGRIGVYELLTITDQIKQIVSNTFPSTVQVRQLAEADGMISMLQDGIIKASMGITDIKEVFRNIQS